MSWKIIWISFSWASSALIVLSTSIRVNTHVGPSWSRLEIFSTLESNYYFQICRSVVSFGLRMLRPNLISEEIPSSQLISKSRLLRLPSGELCILLILFFHCSYQDWIDFSVTLICQKLIDDFFLSSNLVLRI